MNALTKPESVEYEQFFEELDEPCVLFEIVDDEPIVISVNNAFQETFIIDNRPVFAANLNDLIVPDDKIEKAKKLDQRTDRGEVNEVEVERKTKYGVRNFLYRGIPVDDSLGFGIYIDITQRHREREYINVLQRILRHNLRNDLNVVSGFAKRANSIATDDELSECLSNILKKTARIESLIEEADTIRDIISEDYQSGTQLMAVEKVAGSAIGECLSEFSSANVGIECTDGLIVKAGPKLQVAFEAVIDNGLRYNDAEQPRVMIRGHEVNDNRVHISIVDNGVGITTTEKRIITGDKEATQLEHGSGLGLWMTKWIIESYQGTIEIHNSYTGGTVVEFWLNC
jgi:PAS domain S-box